MTDIVPFPKQLIHVEGGAGVRKTWVDGLEDLLRRSYETYKLPSELGAEWGRSTREIDVEDWHEHARTEPLVNVAS